MIKQQFTALLTIPLLLVPLSAQAPKTQALLMAMGANSKQMLTYQWKEKVTVIRKGTPSATILEELRFDGTGQMQRITLSKPEQKKMGPIRARKAAEIKDSVQEVMHLAGRYANPKQIGQAIEKGEVWEGNGSLRVQARSLILPGDEMTMLINTSTLLAARTEIKTQHEGDPVTIVIDYRQLPSGPSVMDRMTVRMPGDDIVVTVDSFDFMRLAVPNVPQL